MFLRYTAFPIIWAIVILLFTLMPGSDMPKMGYFISFDKVAHVFVFAVQVLLLIVAFTKQYSFQVLRENAVTLSLALSAVYGIAIEFMQSLVPGRSLEFTDVMADLFGCLFGWGLFYLLYKAGAEE